MSIYMSRAELEEISEGLITAYDDVTKEMKAAEFKGLDSYFKG